MRTDTTTLIVAFRNFAKAPEKQRNWRDMWYVYMSVLHQQTDTYWIVIRHQIKTNEERAV